MEHVQCNLCGADDYEVLLQGKDRRHGLAGTFPVVRCRQCGMVYVTPRLDGQSLLSYYPDTYAPFARGKGLMVYLTGLLRRREAAKIKQWLPEKGRILEVGCASGDLLIHLRNAGLEATGVEIHPYAASVARNLHGLRVHTSTVASAPIAEGSLDAVVMRSVIEHVPSPKDDLQKIARLLKPGGYLFIRADNFASFSRHIFGEFWHGLDLPRHLQLFSPTTLTKLLQEVGFSVKQIRYSVVTNDWIASIRYLVEEKFGKRSIFKLIALHNPFFIALFLPLTISEKLLKKSSRMDIIATKGR